MGIPYNEEQVRQHLIKEGVWPGGSEDDAGVKSARDWWVRLLKQVTYGVNDHPWDETDDMDDAKREITDTAVEQAVSVAYSTRSILYLLHLSDVDKLDVSDEVEIRLHQTLLHGGDGTRGIYPRSGETYDDPAYRERKEHARQERNEEVNELLKLGSIAKIYLESAAVTVARPWCEAQVKRYRSQWRCELCGETFPSDDGEFDECEGRTECAVHDGDDNCDDHDCSFPHSLVHNDTE